MGQHGMLNARTLFKKTELLRTLEILLDWFKMPKQKYLLLGKYDPHVLHTFTY